MNKLQITVYTVVAKNNFGDETLVRTAVFDNYNEALQTANKWPSDETDIHISKIGQKNFDIISVL